MNWTDTTLFKEVETVAKEYTALLVRVMKQINEKKLVLRRDRDRKNEKQNKATILQVFGLIFIALGEFIGRIINSANSNARS